MGDNREGFDQGRNEEPGPQTGDTDEVRPGQVFETTRTDEEDPAEDDADADADADEGEDEDIESDASPQGIS